MSEPMPEPLTVVEQLPITLLEGVVLAVRVENGAIYLIVHDICTALSINVATQLRRIRSNPLLHAGLRTIPITTAGGPQNQECLELERVPTWLLMINTRRVHETVRPRLEWLQRYLLREVYAAFAAIAGLPPQPSNAIEDLADLQRLDAVLSTLAQRQTTLESEQAALQVSQNQARAAWRELRDEIRTVAARVAAMEQQQSVSTISRVQRGYLYQLVQAWGAALAEHSPQLSRERAHATCWATVKTRYRLARYEDLPADKYDDCVNFIQVSYQSLTGNSLELPEQTGLDL